MAAVSFLGESFSATNGVGLVVLIGGVALFNWNKYQKMLSGQAKGARLAAHADSSFPLCFTFFFEYAAVVLLAC
jgi:hypothetical protein